MPEFCIYGFGLNLRGLEVIKTTNLDLTENEPSEARMVVLLSTALHYINILAIRRFGEILDFHSLSRLSLDVLQMNPARYFLAKVNSPTFIFETLHLLWNKGFADLIRWRHLGLERSVGGFAKVGWLPIRVLNPCIEDLATKNAVLRDAASPSKP